MLDDQLVEDGRDLDRFCRHRPDHRSDPIHAETVAPLKVERNQFAVDFAGRNGIVADDRARLGYVCHVAFHGKANYNNWVHHYHAFGLKLASSIPLPELSPGSGPADVTIRVARGVATRPAGEGWLNGGGERVELFLEDMLFTVDGGRSIAIVAPTERADHDIRVWLLGTAMATLLHQRGCFALHANAVLLPGGGAAAFSGQSGAGKSTMATFLDRAGFHVLGDDLCAIRFEDDDRPLVYPGIPRLKLWAETLALFNRETDGLERVASDLAKYHVPLASVTQTGSLCAEPLKRLYLLCRAGGPGEPLIQHLNGAAAAGAVLDNAFRWGIGQSVAGGDSRLQFDQALAIARNVAVFRLARQWGEDQLFGEATAIAAHLASPLTHSEAAGGVTT